MVLSWNSAYRGTKKCHLLQPFNSLMMFIVNLCNRNHWNVIKINNNKNMYKYKNRYRWQHVIVHMWQLDRQGNELTVLLFICLAQPILFAIHFTHLSHIQYDKLQLPQFCCHQSESFNSINDIKWYKLRMKSRIYLVGCWKRWLNFYTRWQIVTVIVAQYGSTSWLPIELCNWMAVYCYDVYKMFIMNIWRCYQQTMIHANRFTKENMCAGAHKKYRQTKINFLNLQDNVSTRCCSHTAATKAFISFESLKRKKVIKLHGN